MKDEKKPNKKESTNPIDRNNDEDRWPRRRPYDPFGFFDEFEDQFKQMEQRMSRLYHHMLQNHSQNENDPHTRVYGWTYQIGPDGQPHFQEFGNLPQMQSTPTKPQIACQREPCIDIQEAERELYITIELPGVEKQDIQLELKNQILIIEVANDDHPFYKEIPLNSEINERKTQATYNNGILSITLEKQQPKNKGKRINIK